MTDKGSVFVIGSGAAGTAAARGLARAGWQVWMAERDRIGGTCLWRGCIPKKALYAAASAARAVKNTANYGVDCPQPTYDWQGALAWKWHAQETYAGDPEAIDTDAGVTVLHGDARFTSPDEIECDGERYRPDHVVLATGSEPIIPPDMPGRDLVDTSLDALSYPAVPERLVIVGGGFIAMEFAGIFASFGSEVTVLTAADRILEMLDPSLGDVAVRGLGALGVRFVTGCRFTGVDGVEGDLHAHLTEADGEPRSVDTPRVLLAIGRRPALGGLDLEAAAIETDGHGHIVCDATLRTTNPKVWVAGDAAGGMMQTPVANMEGRTVARSIDEGLPQHPDCRAVPITCFTVPQLATVGLTKADAQRAGREVRVSRVALDAVGAAIIEDARDGFAQIVVDEATDVIVGAQVAGPAASDTIYAAALAIRSGMTARELGDCPAVHPSFAEALYYTGG